MREALGSRCANARARARLNVAATGCARPSLAAAGSGPLVAAGRCRRSFIRVTQSRGTFATPRDTNTPALPRSYARFFASTSTPGEGGAGSDELPAMQYYRAKETRRRVN